MKSLQTCLKRLEERTEEDISWVTSNWEWKLEVMYCAVFSAAKKWAKSVCSFGIQQNNDLDNGEPLIEGTETEDFTK